MSRIAYIGPVTLEHALSPEPAMPAERNSPAFQEKSAWAVLITTCAIFLPYLIYALAVGREAPGVGFPPLLLIAAVILYIIAMVVIHIVYGIQLAIIFRRAPITDDISAPSEKPKPARVG